MVQIVAGLVAAKVPELEHSRGHGGRSWLLRVCHRPWYSRVRRGRAQGAACAATSPRTLPPGSKATLVWPTDGKCSAGNIRTGVPATRQDAGLTYTQRLSGRLRRGQKGRPSARHGCGRPRDAQPAGQVGPRSPAWPAGLPVKPRRMFSNAVAVDETTRSGGTSHSPPLLLGV